MQKQKDLRIRFLLIPLLLTLTTALACGDTSSQGNGENIRTPNSGSTNSSDSNDSDDAKKCTSNDDCDASQNEVCGASGQCLQADDPCVKVACQATVEKCEAGVCVPNCPVAEQCNGVCCAEGDVCLGLQCVSYCDDGRLPCMDAAGNGTCCEGGKTCIGQQCVEMGPSCNIANEELCLINEFCDETSGHCVEFSKAPTLCRLESKVGGTLETKINWKDGASLVTPVVLDIDIKDNDPTPVIAFVAFDDPDQRGRLIVMKGTPKPGTTEPEVLWNSDYTVGGPFVDFGFGPAAGIVDDTGKAVFFASTFKTNYDPGGLVAYNYDGTLRYIHPITNRTGRTGRTFGALALGDINGDGKAELVGHGRVIDASNGTFLTDLEDWDRLGVDVPVLSDMNLDGYLDIVDGRRVYLFDKKAYEADNSVFKMKLIPEEEGGSTYPPILRVGMYASGLSAVGYFLPNTSSYPNIVTCGMGRAYISDWRGKEIHSLAAPGGAESERGGPPTVANFDNDPEPEFGCAFANHYVVYDFDPATQKLTQKWAMKSQDHSSAVTGSTVFDFDGDGKVEVVYNDEEHIRIYNGENGHIHVEMINDTGTLAESPVLADVDNDGHADMIAINMTPGGVRVFQGEGNRWAPTRSIWNQHSYHVVNVNKDGTIPAKEEVNWKKRWLNNFRQNIQPGDPNLAPNLVVEADSVSVGSCDMATSFPVTFRIRNIGEKEVPAKSMKSAVLVYLDGSATPENPPYKLFELKEALAAKDAKGYSFEFESKPEWSGRELSLEFVADYEGTVDECIETDNKVRVDGISAPRPDLEVTMVSKNGGCNGSTGAVSFDVTLTNSGPASVPVGVGEVRIYRQAVGSPEVLVQTLTNIKELKTGESEVFEFTETLNMSDANLRNKNVKYRAVVDEENKVLECKEDDGNESVSEVMCIVLS